MSGREDLNLQRAAVKRSAHLAVDAANAAIREDIAKAERAMANGERITVKTHGGFAARYAMQKGYKLADDSGFNAERNKKLLFLFLMVVSVLAALIILPKL